MTLKIRLQKLEQHAAQTCPRPYDLLSEEERKAHILELLRKGNCSEEDAQRLKEEAKRRAENHLPS